MTIYTNKIKTQRGVGLIEALIAAIVVAVGLMALTSLQGGLMHSSGESKARSEAVKLAEAKLEEFRNNINKDSFDTDLAVTDPAGTDSINGTNATFARSWTITDATSPDRKNISVNVSWGGASADETVNMVSQVVWANPGKATDYATDGNGLSAKAPSPNNNSSATPGKQFDLEQITGETALDDGSGLIRYKDDGGNIYLLDSTGKALIQFHGGVIHTIKGHVWEGEVGNGQNPTISLNPLTDFPVTFSDLAYCVFPVTQGESDYICYFGGDCTNQGSGCVSQDESITYEAVSGGWYGKVGLIETSDHNLHNQKVCFAEDIAGTGIETATTTARFYSTQRLNASNNVVGSEGINQSFACQDFLVVGQTGNSNDCNLFQNHSGLSVPSSSVNRTLGPTDSNVSLAENVSSCGSTITYTITGAISGNQANLVQVFVNGNGCTMTSDNGAYSYQCTITVVNTTTSVTITATNGEVTPDSTSITVSTSQPNLTGPTLVANNDAVTETEYHISGTISGDQAGSVDINLSDANGTCTTSQNAVDINYSYECVITTTPTTITITATGGNVSPSTGTVSLADVASVPGPDFVAAAATSITYTITGQVTGNQANSVIFALNGDVNSCTNNNIDNTYTCTITSPPGNVTITATGGNVQPSSATVTLAGMASISGPQFSTNTTCSVTVSGEIAAGQGNTYKVDDVTVTATTTINNTPITCTKTKASGVYTYSCSAGTVPDGGSVTIGGINISIGTGNPVTVNCLGNTSVSITNGPKLTTTAK